MYSSSLPRKFLGLAFDRLGVEALGKKFAVQG
jgi:hypothetical protein